MPPGKAGPSQRWRWWHVASSCSRRVSWPSMARAITQLFLSPFALCDSSACLFFRHTHEAAVIFSDWGPQEVSEAPTTGYDLIYMAQCKMKMHSPLFRNH